MARHVKRDWQLGSVCPLLPLAVALPRMLEKVAVELTTAGPVEACRLRERAQLILDLLRPRATEPPST
jgi:hypothetical protein